MGSETDVAAAAPPLHLIRGAIRGEKPYLVDTPPGTQVKLNQNESPFDLPPELKERLLDRIRKIPFNRYPSDQPARLAKAIAAHMDWDPAGVLVGNGSNDLAHTIGLSLIERPAPVVLPRPMFALYESVVRKFDGKLESVPPADDLRFDAEALCDAIRRHDPALTVVATPNNPTGLAMPFDELREVAAAANGFIIVDEAYGEFNDEPSARTLLDEHPNVLVMRTFSKAWGLAGLRLGFLMGAPSVIQELLKARLPFMVDAIAEETACLLLDHPDIIDDRVAEMKASCTVLTSQLQDLPDVEVVPSKANFVLFKAPLEPAVLIDRLAENGVLIRNMSGYRELAGYCRVNAGLPEENKAFLDALKQALNLS